MFDKYKDYFDIDPEYFPQVNKELIDENPELWKKFYPHATFVRLLKDTISVLSRKQKVSLWVEGAYGTGKSHAVLTVKKLIDSSEEETKEYFERFSNILSNDLFNSLQQIKTSGKILTVHRYGSSGINGDQELSFLIQESIANALEENNMIGGDNTLRNKMISWLSEDWVINGFATRFTEKHRDKFDGADIHQVVENLKSFEGDALQELMAKLLEMGKEEQLPAMKMDTAELIEWIREVIKVNNLKSMIFIWDEFTDFFRNNSGQLSGFQRIVDFSGNEPFYMVIVTHDVNHIFPEGDKDWKVVKGRFLDPICNIELPENMAFELMGAAMEENSDANVQADWHETRDSLYNRTIESRELIKKKANIDDKVLKKILPIHPYAALLLKHISSAFESNQRSMFGFIKNDQGDDVQGFQYFINHIGPEDDNPYLTIDMLWDFFYEKGKELLSYDIKQILDCYPLSLSKNLDENEKRVLKTILLLQAISHKTGNTVELFIPDERNLDNAFEGTDLENGEANKIARSLCKNDVLFERPLQGDKKQYSALINSTNNEELKKKIEEQKNKDTSRLLDEGDFSNTFDLKVFKGALNLRYMVKFATVNTFKRKLAEEPPKIENKIIVIIALAKDDKEALTLRKYIKESVNSGQYPFVFVDGTINPLGVDLLEQYSESMGNSVINSSQDRTLAQQHNKNAVDVLKKWCSKVIDGEFIVYDLDGVDERVNNGEQLASKLERINRKKYPLGLETIRNVNATMWQAGQLKSGAECGITETIKGTYSSSNPETKLENYLNGAWKESEYWITSPSLAISQIKLALDGFINSQFEKHGQVSIKEIYEIVKADKYGFMPCNLSAFILGFLLKEYVNAGIYNYSDGTVSETLTADNLKAMIEEIIKNENTPIARYKDKFIGKMKPEEKAFIEASARIFKLPLNNCVTSEKTRDLIRNKMREFYFPIWCLKHCLENEEIKSTKESISTLIDGFLSIANSGNFGKTDKESALETGNLCMAEPLVVDDLENIMTSAKITAGMDAYLHIYQNGEIISLAEQVGDNGQYINHLKSKFKVNDANWVWNEETANQKINDLILDYKIVVVSNTILPKNTAYEPTIQEWCDCAKKIRISYQYAKNNWEELSDIMSILFDIKKTGRLSDDKREAFYNLISTYGETFKEFCSDPIKVFKESCSFQLSKFDNDEIREIYKKITTDCFSADKASYQNIVNTAIEKFQSEQGSEKLKKLWRDKTQSESPLAWSKVHKTPILCLINDEDIQEAKNAFNTINTKNTSSSSIDKAIHFIEKADFFDRLNNPDVVDEAFRNLILKQYSVMFDDLSEVRSYLSDELSYEVYDWFGMPAVDKKLEKFAQFKYNQSGCDKALEKIDEMDVADVKQYLKELIRDNMTVGIEIIKGK